ncbi:MAG: stage 0 sporulation family protein [Chloroflexi bacterium RBG_16_50_9]|nr:MAG: stage 0 sporulation family protein [Chloroflexi bacterium RBG_16_50_9]
MADVVGIRFKRAGKVYYFDADGIKLEAGDYAVVKTSRGMELGHVVIAPAQVIASEIEEPLSPVMRKAEPDDIKRTEELEAKAEEALIECGKMIGELQLPMKLLSAEYNLDGNRLTIFFSAEERVDFRELVRRLSGKFKVRVELRQVGSRDEAKLIGGFGRCGRPLCCMSFLTEFTPVSIKMAKEQELPLNPMKISGSCGRLMCCLAYEGEQYRVMKEKMPKVGQRVSTQMGEATVVGTNPLKETVLVELESEATVELPLKEVSY